MAPVFLFKAKMFGFALIFAVVSTITYAFASSNTGVLGPGGEGAEVISGYTVSEVSYTFADDTAGIVSVSFQLDAPAAKVQVKLSDTQPDWYECANASGGNWTCNTGNASISSANRIQVIALGN